MAIESEFNETKHAPFTEHHATTTNEYWTMDRVVRWLDVNEFKPAIELFKANHICGKTFLDIDMSYLMAFQNDLPLTYTDKRKFVHAIKNLRTNTEDHYQFRQLNNNSSNSNNGRFNNNGNRYAIPSDSRLPTSDSVIPLIPERKSSNNEQVLDWMKTFNIPKRTIPSTVNTPITSSRANSKNITTTTTTINNNNNLINTTNNNNNNNNSRFPMSPSSPRIIEGDGNWKFVRRRPGQTTTSTPSATSIPTATSYMTMDHPIQQQQQQSIHVTKDSDTFHSLHVTGMHDPRLIKNSILRKLGLEGGCDRYLFYHENGKHSETALTDNELSHICQISDHSSTNRILVKPADHALEHYRSYSKDGTNCYDFAVQGGYQTRSNTRYVNQYPLNNSNNYNSDYNLDSRSRYDNVNGMISPSQFTISSPQETMEDSRDDSGYFDKIGRTSRKQSMDADAGVWSTHPPPTVDSNNRPPLWNVTPQSQRSSTSSTDTQKFYHQQQQQQQQYQLQPTSNLWPVHSSSDMSLASSYSENATTLVNNNLWPVHQEVPKEIISKPPKQQLEQPSFWAVPPKRSQEEALTTSQSLWDIKPSNVTSVNTTASSQYPNNTATNTTMTSSISLWAVAPNNPTTPTPSPSLWAIAPHQAPLKKAESSPVVPTTSSTSPDIQQFGSENLNLHPSISAKTSYHSPPKRGVQFSVSSTDLEPKKESEPTLSSSASAPILEEQVENITLTDPPQPHLSIDTKPPLQHRHSTPMSSPSGNEQDEENWAERPTVEKLYKDIDKYLPGHDLDKEIIVEPTNGNSTNASQTTQPTLVTALPPGRKLQYKKSIRNVAHEAHRNWRNAVNVIRANNLLRRTSTKMWHRTVEQVKPGMKANIQPDDVRPKTKKLQWIRGELIGKGSFGRVYHALNVEAGEWIAVKQVDLPVTKADYANPQLRETKDALFREISLLEDLDNEYIVQYLGYDVDEDEGHINIFLEYVPGGSIASCLAKTGKFDEPLVRFFTRQILMGLAYLHNRNILHRDIKAGNILLDQNGVCKITDFGLSKLSGQDKAYDPHSNNSVMRGTVFWMAPEVVKGTNYNAKIDIWSLGCTVIEMLTGSHPWLDLNMLAALYSLGKYQAPPIPEDLPEVVKDFLNLCFTINPEDRPTAEQLITHPFVQPDASFEFKKYMKKAEIERRASKRMQAIPVEN